MALPVTGSRSRRVTGAFYPKWWGWAPLVVAEALHPLADPLPGLLRAGPLARPGEVARALAASLGALRAVDPPPSWLDSAQSDAFRLLLPVLRKYGAALCAEPVGTGKTYIALAVANAIGPASSVAVVPAALVEQWRGTAQRLGISMTVWSHARLSLGRLPPDHPALVIVDESHHFRNPVIRRYRTLAPWLAGRQVLLLSATPIVNHARDLFHQLHLGIRDDALAADGAPSMRAAFDRDNIPAALGRFVVQRLNGQTRPSSASRRVSAHSGAVALIPDLDSLRLSSDRGIAALVRSVFLRAASSSAAALEGSLRRYRALLLHARDARDSGRALDRASLRRFTFGADDQLLLWALFPTEARESELRVDDLPVTGGHPCASRRAGQTCRCEVGTVAHHPVRRPPFGGVHRGPGNDPLPPESVDKPVRRLVHRRTERHRTGRVSSRNRAQLVPSRRTGSPSARDRPTRRPARNRRGGGGTRPPGGGPNCPLRPALDRGAPAAT